MAKFLTRLLPLLCFLLPLLSSMLLLLLPLIPAIPAAAIPDPAAAFPAAAQVIGDELIDQLVALVRSLPRVIAQTPLRPLLKCTTLPATPGGVPGFTHATSIIQSARAEGGAGQKNLPADPTLPKGPDLLSILTGYRPLQKAR